MAETRQLDLVLNLQDKASKELKGFNGQLEKMQPAFQKMALVGGVAVAGIGAGIKKAVDNAVDLGESINAVQVVFRDGADKILEFGKTASKSVGLANAEFNQLATMTGALLKDVGMPMEEVSDMTIELTKRASDLASVFNTDVEDAMSAINQAVRGETEAIRRYTGDVTDATLESYRLSKGMKTAVTEMNQQEKRLLRVQVLMEQTAFATDDFANTSDSLANQQRILRGQLIDMSTTLGNTFIPIISDLLKKIVPVINKVGEWLKENPELAKQIVIATGALAGLVAVLGAVGLILPSVITGVKLLGTATLLTGKGIAGLTSLIFSPAGLLVALTAVTAYLVTKAIIAYQDLQYHLETLNKVMKENQERIDRTSKAIKDIPDGEYRTKLENMNKSAQEHNDKLKEMQERYEGLPGIWFAVLDQFKDWGKQVLELLGKVADKAWEYWQKILGGKNKASTSSSKSAPSGIFNPLSVDDAVITPQGQVIKTNPMDYLIATKNPGALAGAGNVTVNINGGYYLDREAGQKLSDLISENLRLKLRI